MYIIEGLKSPNPSRNKIAIPSWNQVAQDEIKLLNTEIKLTKPKSSRPSCLKSHWQNWNPIAISETKLPKLKYVNLAEIQVTLCSRNPVTLADIQVTLSEIKLP
jgi:hypothetical protein